MNKISSYLQTLEGIRSPLEAIIRATKIDKVLRAIKRLPEIPRESEFHLKKRATSLLEEWNPTLDPQERPAATNTAQNQSEIVSQPLIIDLTDSSESEPSPQPTRGHDNRLRAVPNVPTLSGEPQL